MFANLPREHSPRLLWTDRCWDQTQTVHLLVPENIHYLVTCFLSSHFKGVKSVQHRTRYQSPLTIMQGLKDLFINTKNMRYGESLMSSQPGVYFTEKSDPDRQWHFKKSSTAQGLECWVKLTWGELTASENPSGLRGSASLGVLGTTLSSAASCSNPLN